MRRSDTQRAERWAVRHIGGVVEDDLDWTFREQPLPDYGVDAQIEVGADDDLVTGRLLGLQIKGGNSHFREPQGDQGWIFRESNNHLAYWLSHSLPMIVVLVDSERRAYWQVITPDTVTEREKRFWILVPRSQPFDATAKEALLALAGRREGLLEQLPSYYTVLPPAAVDPLRRAEKVDQLAAARLAERLTDGRDNAGMTAASVIAAGPSWLVDSLAAQDLWLAVAAYAGQHSFVTEAGAAYLRAADSEGPRSARSLAEAGLSLIPSDRDRARECLLRARDEDQVLLADVGLSMLDLPENDGRPAEIPDSIRAASTEALQAEPVTLLFLAESANRREELDAAVGYAERAVTIVSDRDTVSRLTLARLIHRRAISTDMSSHELRRALKYAQEIIRERRQWSGPSTEALALLLDIHVSGDMNAAVTAALPVSEGGTALDQEAASPEITRRGALAALATENDSAYTLFMEQLPDGPHRRELLSLEAESNGRPAAERIADLTDLLQSPVDDQMTARSIAALVKLGVWPDQADQLRARSVLPAETYDMLKAIYRVRSGDALLGIAKLREMAATSAHAATELVQILEDVEGPEIAIEEAKRQLPRWPIPPLTLKLLDLLGRSGRDEQAAAMIERTSTDDTLPAAVRLRLAAWYAARRASQHEYAEAAAFARKALEIGEDPDLAWILAKTLVNDGKVAAARLALARHRPEPIGDDEIRLWMQLHLGVPLDPTDAATMVSIVQRLADGPFRDAVIGVLIREVLLTPAEPGNSQSAEVIDAVRQIQEEAEDRPGGSIQLASDDDAALRALLEDTQLDHKAYEALIVQVHEGRAGLADIARLTGRPYATALLQRPGGIIPAIDLSPEIRRAGEDAAEHALQAGSCVADLSALHLLNLGGDDDRLRIRAALPHIVVARSSVADTLLTRDQLRGLALSSYTAGLRPDGSVVRTPLTATQKATLRQQAEALEKLAASMDTRSSATHVSAAADTIAVAKEVGQPLWCDDIALRQKARQAGVTAFDILDLTTCLNRHGHAIDQTSLLRRLATQYVMDLPLSAEDVVALAVADYWVPGPVHSVLARSEWWRHLGDTWTTTWLHIAGEACKHSTEAFVGITKAALYGSVSSVVPGQATRRYQQLVVLALLACHNVAELPPDDLLTTLAEGANPAIVPRPRYVLANLITELVARSVENAAGIAHGLLPTVDFGSS